MTTILYPIMDSRNFQCKYLWILVAVTLVACFHEVHGQSCGPRVSARLLAEIPCDMSKSSYCSAPGSAYPWSSVKRYINDNQGLVRRMYGDELHSSVLLNEIDGFRFKYEQLRSFMNRGYSRMEYGRSARGSRRQPRPQIFDDDDNDDTPATIFRVVTETSIKVGDPVTRPMSSSPTQQTATSRPMSSNPTQQTPTYKPATADYDHTSTKYTSEATTVTTSSTTEQTPTQQTEPTTTETIMDTTYMKTTTEATSTTSEPTTTETTVESTTSSVPDLPVAMERIGHEDIDDYDYEPDRKTVSGVRQNSVEEKTKYKHDSPDVKRNDPLKYDDATLYEVVADDVTKEPVTETTEAKDKETEADEEEIPRRGINACPVKNEVIAPYWANNTRGETLALLNVHPFEQYVHFEKCAFENHQMLCREGCRCEQQYRLHRLLAFDPKNECRGIFSDWFRFPSCCVCICYDLTPDIPRTRSRKARM